MMKFTSIFLFWVAFAAATASTYVPCNDCIDRAPPKVLANISLRLYPSTTIDQYKTVLVKNVLDLCDKMNTSKPTIMYIFGWMEGPDSESVHTILGAYLQRQDHNIMLVDWQEIAAKLYPYSAFSAHGVGYTVATAIKKLVAAGCLNSTTLHIVGHSLGAHISGFIGRSVNFTLPRITGLDPAGPGYYVMIDELDSSDAGFVDVIHTDKGVFGSGNNTGTVDFHPNGGNSQPGCLFTTMILPNICSHARSWKYYAESVSKEDAFIGVGCGSYLSFVWGFCTRNPTVVMGYATPTTARGIVYLQTNSALPFGRGSKGTTYSLM